MKAVLGKPALPGTPRELGILAIDEGLDVIPLTIAHIDRFHRLPIAHRDAFDRLLAATAGLEGCVFLSPDAGIDALGIKRVW